MNTGLCHLAHFVIVADAIMCCFHTGLGGHKIRQRERHMMQNFDIIRTRENFFGLWSGNPPHLKRVLMSVAAPAMTAGSQPVTNANSPTEMALKKKHKKFFSASQKSTGLPDEQIPQVGYVPTRSASVEQLFQRVQSQKHTRVGKGTM
jgi:hypothetical protein